MIILLFTSIRICKLTNLLIFLVLNYLGIYFLSSHNFHNLFVLKNKLYNKIFLIFVILRMLKLKIIYNILIN